MPYAELQKAAKELDLPANGTKEELISRLEGATPAETPEEPKVDTPEEAEEAEKMEKPEEPEAPANPKAKATDKEVEKQWRGDALKMKEHLAGQKKVIIMIPLEVGVAPEVAEKIPFVCNPNGYRFSIKRGVFEEVPEQVANMIKERLESEGKIGRDLRIDRNPNTLEALG